MRLYRVPAVGMDHGVGNVVDSLVSLLVNKKIEVVPGLFGCHDIYDFCSGKAALVIAFKALSQLEPSRREVVLPAYTCYSVAAAVEAAGLKLVLCDVVPETLDFDYEMLLSITNSNTLCVVATHLFSKSADVARTREVVDGVGAFLIEDAAQSGIDIDQKQMLSDVVVYSFARGKPLSTNGGGILAVNHKSISKEISLLHGNLPAPGLFQEFKSAFMMLVSNILIQPSVFWLPAKLPFLGIGKTVYPNHIFVEKMGNLRLFLLHKLVRKIVVLSELRQTNAAFYSDQLEKNDTVQLLVFPQSRGHALIRFPCYLRGDVELSKKNKTFSGEELGVSRMYPHGLHQLEQIKPFFLNYNDSFPGADFISDHLITLPTHPLVDDVARIRVVAWLDGVACG